MVNSLSLHGHDGQRKYLNQQERLRFLAVAKLQPTEISLFCQLLYYTGARIGEIHNLSTQSIDHPNGTVVIESLKKRKHGVFREIPIPNDLLNDLKVYYEDNNQDRLWSFSLRTASRKVKRIMIAANIKGIRSSAKGLRHGFAVYAVTKVPLVMVKKWLGHSKLETTEIYLNVVGAEERALASRIW